MIPALVVGVTVLGGVAAALIVWIVNKAVNLASQFREDVIGRLNTQDQEQAAQREILSSIRALLKDEVHKVRSKLWHHETRIGRLEEHSGLPMMRRYDDQDTGD